MVSDDPLVRGGLSALLEGLPGIVVAAQSGVEDLAALVASSAPDVAVWDVGPPASGALEGLPEIADVPVLAVVALDTQAPEALSAGARGVVLRDAGGERLGAALRAISSGLVVVEDALAETVLRPRRSPADLPEALTPRELEVLQLLSQGLANKAIARRLDISEHTAKFHVNSILGKLGAESRTEALVLAARAGLVVL